MLGHLVTAAVALPATTLLAQPRLSEIAQLLRAWPAPWPNFSTSNVLAHRAAETCTYVGSPALHVSENGVLLAACDQFGPASRSETLIFASLDRGATWTRRATVDGLRAGGFHSLPGGLHLIGVEGPGRHLSIRRSTDEGRAWTEPADERTGLLRADTVYHTAPVPGVVAQRRFFRAVEDLGGAGGWPNYFRAMVMSASIDDDLLDARSWTLSNALEGNTAWLDGRFQGWLEGNLVVAPEGRVKNILRVHEPQGGGYAAIVDVDEDGRTVGFDDRSGFVRMPGGAKKFTIRFDSRSQRYWSLTNWIPDRRAVPDVSAVRNTLVLISSRDLRHWQIRSIVAHDHDEVRAGFQYADFRFDGDDLLAVIRTAYDAGFGAPMRAHDANMLTFRRIRAFRDCRMVALDALQGGCVA